MTKENKEIITVDKNSQNVEIVEEKKTLKEYVLSEVKKGTSLEEIYDGVEKEYKKSYHTVRKVIEELKKEGAIGRRYINAKINEANIKKLEQYLKKDYSVKQACFKVGIPESSIYYFWSKNPEHKAYCETLRESPVMKAKDILDKELENDNVDVAKFTRSEENRKERSRMQIEILANRNTETPQDNNYVPPAVSVKFTIK